MYKEVKANVVDIHFEDEEIQQLIIDNGVGRALLYKRMTESVKVGDQVVVNTTAAELNLGTGGWDIVRHVIHHKVEYDWGTGDNRGHIIKARYTPIQHSVLTVEEQKSVYHHYFTKPFSLAGRPVLLAELHSMVPLIFYLMKEMKKDVRCCVIFDDQAALPLMISEQLRQLHTEEQFTSITVGQAFGGNYEAVTIASALQCATMIDKADVIVISVGPGVVGTGTCFGFTGMAQSHWSHIVSALYGVPIWIPRMSFADRRNRHYGISHHTLTPLSQFTFKKAVVPIPFMKEQQRAIVEQQLEKQSFQVIHDIHFADQDSVSPVMKYALKRAPLPIQTMGRKFEDDPVFFLAVAEALRVGLELLE